MAEQQDPAQVVNPVTPEPEPQNPNTIPYDRFKEVNDAKKALEERVAQIEADRKAAEDAKLAEQGEFKALLEKRDAELKALQNQFNGVNEKWTSYEAGRRKTLIEQLPADLQEKYKEHELSVIEDIVAISKNVTPTPTVDVSRPGDNRLTDYKSWADLATAHRLGKITTKEYHEQKKAFTKRA